MSSVSMEDIIMNLVVYGGDARAKAMQAITEAKAGNYEQADAYLEEAREEINKAHVFQTELIQKEAGGEKTDISLVLIHGQDHLMTAGVVIDLATQMVEMYKQFSK
ncbi:MAG: PTS lactose/cellobiose transporter subunit IIA [Lachnospiraceae bacterium]|nr:PTS lactose/cellobiose transporter subunit IIA [Lachnospiraceae bacterium]